MDINEMLKGVRDATTVKRVFGDPYEKDGLTLIPAAFVQGSGGGGSGKDQLGQEGGGGGFNVMGHPVGAYVLKDGDVRWIPAVDPAKLLAILGFVVLGALTIRAKLVKAHLRSGRHGRRGCCGRRKRGMGHMGHMAHEGHDGHPCHGCHEGHEGHAHMGHMGHGGHPGHSHEADETDAT